MSSDKLAERMAGPKGAWPGVTVAVISYNRLNYLRATLESARACIQYPNIEWIVNDGQSDEPGLREYIESLDWLDHRLYHRQTHAEAMNRIMELARGEFVLIWPEDVQFIVRGDWMGDLVEIMARHDFIGSMCLDGMRAATLEAVFKPRLWANRGRLMDEIVRYGVRFRRSRLLRSSRGFAVRTFGWVKQGVCGSGIPSLTRTSLWRRLGPWKTGQAEGVRLVDSSLGAEDDMVARFYRSRLPLQGATPMVPVAADIVTDPTGCKAKIRGRYRYGVYMPPPEGVFYYRIRDLADIKPSRSDMPMSFAESVEPIGFRIPVDERGDRLKSSLNPSVVYDRVAGKEVPYPLMTGSGS